MALIGLKNLNAFTAKTVKQRERVKQRATTFVQQKVRTILQDALRASPQWSGNFAANWVIETNQTGPSNYTARFKVRDWASLTPKFAGHQDAIAWATEVNRGTISELRWNSIVRLRNYTPIADSIESRTVPLRAVNTTLIGVAGVLDYVKSKHQFLRKI